MSAHWGVRGGTGLRGRGVGSEVCPLGGTINPQVISTERLWYLLTQSVPLALQRTSTVRVPPSSILRSRVPATPPVPLLWRQTSDATPSTPYPLAYPISQSTFLVLRRSSAFASRKSRHENASLVRRRRADGRAADSDTSPFSRTTPFDGGPNGQGRCHPVLANTPKGSMAPLLPRRRPSFCRSRLTLSTDGAVRTPGQNQWSSSSMAQSTPAGQPLYTRRSERRPRPPSPPRLGRYSWATARIWRRHTGRLRTACATGGTPARRSSPHASRLTCHAGSRLGSLATCSAESPPWPRRSASDLSPGRQRCNPIRLQP